MNRILLFFACYVVSSDATAQEKLKTTPVYNNTRFERTLNAPTPAGLFRYNKYSLLRNEPEAVTGSASPTFRENLFLQRMGFRTDTPVIRGMNIQRKNFRKQF